MNNLSNRNIVRININNNLSEDIKKYKILYFSAPTGWGKTVAITNWLNKETIEYSFLSVSNQNTFIQELKQISLDETRKQIIIIDDFHNITDCTIRNEIIDFISITSVFCHFIILSRAEVTYEFNPFVITRQLKSYGEESFKFTYEECEQFLELNEIMVTEDILTFAYKKCQGYPISLNSLVSNIKKNNGIFTKKIVNQLQKDLFNYYDITLFNNWSDEIKSFLISIVSLDEFTPLLAQMVTLKSNVKCILDKCNCMGSFLIISSPDTYKVHYFFKKYLLYKQKQLLDEDSLKNIYISAGNYYEMIGNHTAQALKYYHVAGENEKVKNILMKEATFGACKSNLIEFEPYYLSLKEEDILKSPILCSGMSMLYSLNGKINESEYWFNNLIEMKKAIPKNETDYKIAQEQIAYLSIALPHTGASGMVSKIGNIAKHFAKNGFHMQDISITGNMPSLMHGGKDFCEWSKSAETLRKMLKGFVEFIFVTDGVGLADTGVGEAYYEQNKLDSALIELTKGTTDSRNKGSVEMLFAGTAVLVKLLVAKGEYESAVSMMEGLKDIIEQKSIHLLPNYDAFMVRLKLLNGKTDYAQKWLETQVLDENINFYTIERYRYMTKIRIYIIDEKYTQAQILLERLKKYYIEYKRTFDYMEATLLQSIIYFRQEDERWYERLNEVLVKARGYKFIRIIADEGNAIYPLLIKLKQDNLSKVDIVYLNELITEARKQAILYSNYLDYDNNSKIVLTKTETAVLKLLVSGKKYREIEDLMVISSNTVKFHIKNIYRKLNVTGKSEAIRKAIKLNLV